jgi:hypothetical protein
MAPSTASRPSLGWADEGVCPYVGLDWGAGLALRGSCQSVRNGGGEAGWGFGMIG